MDRDHVFSVLDGHKPDMIIEGGAPGADRLARLWSESRGVHCASVCALWGKYGKKAGPLRNAAMLDLRPDVVIAFPGGSGTANMVRQAEAAGVRVCMVPPTGTQHE